MAWGTAPPGYGHNFATRDYTMAWYDLTEPDGWTRLKLQELKTKLSLHKKDPHKLAQKRAQQWIKNNSPTYVYDGFDLTLKDAENISGNKYRLRYSFKSRGAGYGDRSNKMIAQVITDHELVVTVEDNEVTKAISDEKYDELNDRMITAGDQAKKVELVFYQTVEGQEEPVTVRRKLETTKNIEKETLQLLLGGPTAREEKRGIYSTIASETKLLDFEIENNIARVNFSRHLEPGGGSAWMRAIQNQINKTLKQFDTIEEVKIAVEGKTEEILQP